MNAVTKTSAATFSGVFDGRLGDDRAAHAVADEDRRLRARGEHLGTRCAQLASVTSPDGVSSFPPPGQVERLDRVPGRLERLPQRLQAPGPAERAVDEDETCHPSRRL